MKCMSCDFEINPQWKHAIDSNVCPFCGNLIMDEKLKTLLLTLRMTMDELYLGYTEQLEDWLRANYNLSKGNSKKPISVNNSSDNNSSGLDSRTKEIFVGAGLIKPADESGSISDRNKHLKELATKIKREGIASGMTFMDGPVSSAPLSDEEVNDINEIMGNNFDEPQEIHSALDSGVSDEIPEVVLRMANRSKNTSSNVADVIKHQNMIDRVNQSKKNFASGSNRGKNGFSRVG